MTPALKLQEFCWKRWTLAERAASALGSTTKGITRAVRKAVEDRCEFWRQMHFEAETRRMQETKAWRLGALAEAHPGEPDYFFHPPQLQSESGGHFPKRINYGAFQNPESGFLQPLK